MDAERERAYKGLLTIKMDIALSPESATALDRAVSYLMSLRDTRNEGMIEAAEFVESLKLRNLGKELRRRASRPAA